jgi:molecular chaperone DnaJ
MAERNLYTVLGISRRESPEGIRAAYLELAKKNHPDVSGREEASAFQENAEAYRVLSDPELRRRHDERWYGLEARPSVGAPVPMWRRERSVAALRPEPLDVMGAPEAVHTSFAALYDRFLRNFTGHGVPRSERVEPLGFDVVLTPDEAASGGVIPVAVPVFAR